MIQAPNCRMNWDWKSLARAVFALWKNQVGAKFPNNFICTLVLSTIFVVDLGNGESTTSSYVVRSIYLCRKTTLSTRYWKKRAVCNPPWNVTDIARVSPIVWARVCVCAWVHLCVYACMKSRYQYALESCIWQIMCWQFERSLHICCWCECVHYE